MDNETKIAKLHDALGIMDSSANNEGCTSQLIWNDRFNEMRTAVLEVLNALQGVETYPEIDLSKIMRV